MKEITNKKWAFITKINKEFDILYHRIAVHYNLSDSNFWILYSLYESKKPCTQKEICDDWYFNKQTINSSIKNLVELGYIRKGNEEKNNTNKKIELTPLGLEIAEKTVCEVMKIEDIAFSKISDRDLDKIIELLEKPLVSFREEVNKLV